MRAAAEPTPKTPGKPAQCASQRGSLERTATAPPRSLREISARKTTHKKRRQGREEVALTDREQRRRRFPVLRDADLGLERAFQVMVHPSSHDDDCDTDEEQLDCSRNFCLAQLREGILREFGAQALERWAAGGDSPARSPSDLSEEGSPA